LTIFIPPIATPPVNNGQVALDRFTSADELPSVLPLPRQNRPCQTVRLLLAC
jgi:hypothetical protein